MTTRGVAVIVTILWAVAGPPAQVRGQTPARPRILVMPFDNVTRETSIFWLGEGSAVLLADALGASAIARDERREAFEQLQVPPNATLTDATVIRIAQLVGAAEVITGSVQMEGDTLIVHARGIALESGRIVHDIVDRGPASEMVVTFDRIARQFASPTQPSADGRRVPPLAAFENYIKGLLAETPTIAVNYLNAALSAQPTFARARLALWEVYADQGDHARALAAVTSVPADSEWSRRASFLAGLSYLNLKKYDEAFSAFKSVADAQPSASALNNIGIVQIRRSATTPQPGQPSYYFNKAAEVDANDPDYFFNLGYSFWLVKDYQASIYWLKEAVRRNPADGDAHFVLGAALAAGGSPVEAVRERELARRLSSTYEQWERRPAAEVVPKGLERVKGGVELPHQQIEAALASNGQRDQRELARFYLDRGRRLYQMENDRAAIAELNRAIYLSPYEAEAHLLVGRIHLRNSRVREAIDAFKISLWSSETTSAHLALGDAYLQMKDVNAAKAEAERALSLEPASSEARQLLSRLGDAR